MSETVRNMFSRIAGKYDLMNDIFSFGIHRRWRRKLVRNSGIKSGDKVLDCATGTGDLAFEFKKAFRDEIYVTGADFCAEMLEIAKTKSIENGLKVKFIQDDAMDLKSPPGTYNIISIAFGIRNTDDPVACLRSMARAAVKGGRVIILEFGKPLPYFAWIYNIYAKWLIPFIGKIFSGDKAPYFYLQQTASEFPCREKFLELMKDAGCFSETSYKPLSFGIAYIYTGIT